jgi:cytochrome b pre-mRNA-processing protein 3
MLAFLKKKNPSEQDAAPAYAAVLMQVRRPQFYAQFSVPDTFDGRFDLMLVHLFLLIDRMIAEGPAGLDFNQDLFDVTFADMDQTLRERGIGDMGMPKHMRRMMKAFNGRMHAYDIAIKGTAAMEEVLARNLFGTIENPPAHGLAAMAAYIRDSRDALRTQSFENIKAGRAVFAPLPAEA